MPLLCTSRASPAGPGEGASSLRRGEPLPAAYNEPHGGTRVKRRTRVNRAHSKHTEKNYQACTRQGSPPSPSAAGNRVTLGDFGVWVWLFPGFVF